MNEQQIKELFEQLGRTVWDRDELIASAKRIKKQVRQVLQAGAVEQGVRANIAAEEEERKKKPAKTTKAK